MAVPCAPGDAETRRVERAFLGQGGGSAEWGSFSHRGPMQIEGGARRDLDRQIGFAKGAPVFHLKFGPGAVALIDGTVEFGKAGRKMVLGSFVQAV